MYPSTQNTGNLIDLIKSIGKNGVPDKFTTKDLPIWGYKSSHDRSIVSVLKFINFIDNSGVPTELWKEARTKPEIATAKGIRSGYQDLYKTFPDAHRKDAEALINFFKAKTTVGDAAVKKMVSTFRALAQLGDFEADTADTPTSLPPTHSNGSGQQSVLTSSVAGAQGIVVNLNIELSIPSDSTGEIYDKFFSAMKKHLIDSVK